MMWLLVIHFEHAASYKDCLQSAHDPLIHYSVGIVLQAFTSFIALTSAVLCRDQTKQSLPPINEVEYITWIIELDTITSNLPTYQPEITFKFLNTVSKIPSEGHTINFLL